MSTDPTGGEFGPAPTAAPAAKVTPSTWQGDDRDASGQRRWNDLPGAQGDAVVRWRAKEAARISGRPAPDPAAPAKPDQPAAAKPSDTAPDTVRIGDVSVTSQEMKDFLAARAAKLSGQLQAPASAEEYLLELPNDLVLPPGIEVALDKNDPILGQLRGWAHKYQLPQQALSEALGLYAGKIAGERAIGQAAHLKQVELLGHAGPARVDAIALWLKGELGDQGKVISGERGPDGFVRSGCLWTADICRAFESLMMKQRGGGGGGYRPNGSDNGVSDGKIPGFAKMDFAQQRHAQEQLRHAREAAARGRR